MAKKQLQLFEINKIFVLNFSFLQGNCLLLHTDYHYQPIIHYQMQVVDAKFVAHWKHQYWAPLSWGSMEFSAFLVFAVWTSSTTYLTFGKGELQNAHHFPPLYSYSSPCYLIFRHSLFLFRWFTTADALSLLTCRYDKIKNLNTINMVFKGRNLSLVNFFCRY